jgi:hypothetical protein
MIAGLFTFWMIAGAKEISALLGGAVPVLAHSCAVRPGSGAIPDLGNPADR